MRHYRFWEIDWLRGIAVVGMIIYHLLVDLEIFYAINIAIFDLPWIFLARSVATIFIILLGIGASIKIKYKHILEILLAASVITLVTYFLFPKDYIVFGILHFMGIALILLIPLRLIKSKIILFILSLSFIIGGYFISNWQINSWWWLWLGVTPTNFQSLDYFPLFPWFGVAILGVLAGKIYYPWRKQHEFFPQMEKIIINQKLSQMGRNSLFWYLIHQPVLLSILFLLKKLLV